MMWPFPTSSPPAEMGVKIDTLAQRNIRAHASRVIRTVLLLVATLLSVTLPPTPQLTLDRLAELSLPEHASSMVAVLDDGERNKATETSANKRTPKPPTPAVTVSLRLMTMRRIVVLIEETVTHQRPAVSPKLALHDDVRRAVRRSRPLAHPPSPDDPAAA